MQKLLAIALLCATSTAALAAEKSVSYQCGGGKAVTVSYHFNEAGLPTQASALLQGKTRVMEYNLERSDNVETLFNNAEGYRLSTSYMDSQNYREQGIVITSPKDELLFKNCFAEQAAAPKLSATEVDASAVSTRKRVAYQCQGGKSLTVEYGFNAVGLPVNASASLAGKQMTLAYDLNRSDDVSAFFTQHGYVLSTEAISVDNYRQAPVIVTAPNDELLYKGCSAK